MATFTLALLLASAAVPVIAMDIAEEQISERSLSPSIPEAAHVLAQTFSDNPNAFNVNVPRKFDPNHHQDQTINETWPFYPSQNDLSQAILERMQNDPAYFTSGKFTEDLNRVSKTRMIFNLPANQEKIKTVLEALIVLEKHGMKKQLSSADIRGSAKLVDEDGKDIPYKSVGAAVLYLQNLMMIEQDPLKEERINRVASQSVVYDHPDRIDITSIKPLFDSTKINIESSDLVSVAMKIHASRKGEGVGKKIGLIIPGDDVNVGGGPTEANAAEENIGRLIPYALLSQVAIAEGYGYPLPSNGVLVIDDVDVMRDPTTLALLPKDQVFPVTLINAAAPDLRALIKDSFRTPLLKAYMADESIQQKLSAIENDGDRKKEGWKIEGEFLASPEYKALLNVFRNMYYANHPEYKELLLNKIESMVKAAVKANITDLVIPAWGGGVFENDIDFIGDGFNDTFQRYKEYIETATLVVFPDTSKALNEAAFQKIKRAFDE